MDDLNARSADGQPPNAPSLTDGDYRRLADFRRALRGFFAFSKEAVGGVGLAPAQYQALLAIRAHEGREGEYTIGDLAEELYIRHHSAVELVDRLEKAGLIVRKPAAKGRRVIPLLTPEARAILAQLAQMHLAQLRRYAPEMARHLWTSEDDKS